VENIPSIRRKAEFCFRWIDSVHQLRELRTAADRRTFLLNVICFAACIEGLFFYGAFADVYFLRSRSLLNGLASGTNWVFRDESMHMRSYLEHVADRRLAQLGIEELYGSKNPFTFMDLQDVQELSNFFERRVSAYQVGVTGTVAFDHDF
jgi:ribonucleoside-diphosphate reductase beta chain